MKEDEQARASRFLHFASHEKVDRLSSELLVEAQKDRFDSVCRQMIENEALTGFSGYFCPNELYLDMHNMYLLLKPIPDGFAVLLHELGDFIKHTGVSMVVEASNEPSDFVSNVQRLHQRFSTIVKDVFNNESEFIATLDRVYFIVRFNFIF